VRGNCAYLNLQRLATWKHARWVLFHGYPKKIFVRQFVAVIIFQEIKVKSCIRVAQTHKTRVKGS
jgi:hypothetical protein